MWHGKRNLPIVSIKILQRLYCVEYLILVTIFLGEVAAE